MSRAHRIQFLYETQPTAEATGLDTWLDLLETDLRAIGQRRMTKDQRERFLSLIEDGYTAVRARRKVAA